MDANIFFGIFSRMKRARASHTPGESAPSAQQNLKPTTPKTPHKKRLNERGNVFFTLFGAVAIVGVLGAGIMSTMRGPLSTMVEVNRREQAKAEARVAASLILVTSGATNAGDNCGDLDGLTEGIAPGANIGLTGGGAIPATVSSAKNDPWGNPYGYCAWDHGIDAATTGGSAGACTSSGILAGDLDTNNYAIAVISSGPNGVFDTTCSDHNTYLNDPTGAVDDIVEPLTYNQAVAGSGGLWSIKSGQPNVAEISKDIEVTGSASFSDVLAAQAGMSLPDDTALSTCNAANDRVLRVNESTAVPQIEICVNGTGWVSAGSTWTLNGSDVFYNAGDVGIGLNNPNDALDVVGTAQVTGAVDFDSTLNVDGAATLNTTLGVTGATTLSSTLGVTGTSSLGNDVTITGGATGGTTDALSVRDSSSSVVFTVQNDGNVGIGVSNPSEELDVAGDITASGVYMIGGTKILSNDGVNTNILLGDVTAFSSATNYMNLGDAIHADLTTANKRVGIGFADNYDVSLFNDTLEVNGTVDISDTLNVTNNATIGGDATVTGALGVSGTGTFSGAGNGLVVTNDADIGGTLEADDYTYQGADFSPVACANDGSEFSFWDGGGWACNPDTAGGGGGGGAQTIEETLQAGNDAGGETAVDLGGVAIGSGSIAAGYELDVTGEAAISGGLAIGSTTLSAGTATLELDVTGEVGATEYCDAAGNNCFTTDEMNQTIAEVLGVGNDAGGSTNLLNLQGLAIGSSTLSSGAETLEIDVTGDVGATNFCDADGNNCFTAASVASGSSPAPGSDREIVFNSNGQFHAETNFVYTADGDFVVGSPQIEDTGTGSEDIRMFFDVSKGVFRVGSVDGAQWDYTSSGNYSVAMGYNAVASGNISVALGRGVASGGDAIALGIATASGSRSVAMGNNAVASQQSSIAMGNTAIASGNGSVSIGTVTTASGTSSMATGSLTTASGDYSTAMGRGTIAGGNTSNATGSNVNANGDSAMGFGLQTQNQTTRPIITGDRSAVFFFDGNTADANSGYNFTDSDKFALIGGEFVIDSESSSTASKGCIRYDDTNDKLQYSHDCTSYDTLGDPNSIDAPGNDSEIIYNSNGALWTDANFVFTSAGWLGVGSPTPQASLDIATTHSVLMPRGTTAQRPGLSVNGMFRYNADNDRFEGYQGGAWQDVLTDAALAAGAQGQLQFNSGGALGASTNLHWDNTNSRLGIGDATPEVALDVLGTLQIGNGGETCDGTIPGAIRYNSSAIEYCDGTNWKSVTTGGNFTDLADTPVNYTGHGTKLVRVNPGETALEFLPANQAGVWSLGTGDDIYYNSGTPQVGIGTASPDDTLDVVGTMQVTGASVLGSTLQVDGNTTLPTGTLAVGSATVSTGGQQDLEVDITGDVGAANFCDADGNNCFTAASVSSGSSPAPGNDREIVFNSNGQFHAETNFVYTADGDLIVGSTQTGDTTTGSEDYRMFFDRSKGALRAGAVMGNEWDDANVGNLSTALGAGSTASGDYSFAVGTTATATSTGSIAIGTFATSGGSSSVAIGNTALAVGDTSISIGRNTTANALTGAVAIGNSLSATGNGSIAMGVRTSATANNALALGLGSASGAAPIVSGASSYGIFMGDQSAVNFASSNTMGLFGGSMVIDPNVPATNLSADTAFEVEGTIKMAYGGEACDASREGAIHYNSSDNNFYLCKSAGSWSLIATGTPSAAAPDRGIQFNSGGNFAADANFTYTSAGDFIVGSYQLDDTGTGSEDFRMFFDRSKGAFRAGHVFSTEWDDANVGIRSVAMGAGTTASGNFSTAMGNGTSATNGSDTAMGAGTTASGGASTAMGWTTTASGQASTAMGHGTIASGVSSTAMGSYTSAGDYSMAIGLTSTNPATDPTVTGQQSLGIFMGDQDGLVFASSNTMGLFGGQMVIDPNVPATNLSADTALEVEGAVKVGYDATTCSATIEGAIRYDSASTFMEMCNGTSWVVVNTGAGGLWTAGTGDDIYYNSGASMVGIGLTDPAVSLDVAGLIRPGYDAACTATEEGAIRYDSGSDTAELCDGTSWLTINTGVGGKWSDALSAGNIYYTSSVGIGTNDPQVALDVDGTIRIADGGEACDGTIGGGIRYRSGIGVEYCDGTSWVNLAVTGTGVVLNINPPNKLDMDVTGPGAPASGTNVVFNITNTGAVTSNALSYSLTNTTNFNVTSDTCTGNTIAPAASCQIEITPQATTDGTFFGTLSIDQHNNPQATLQGVGSSFGCYAGQVVASGVVVQCDYAGAGNHLIVMESGCDGTTNNPTCGGADTYTRQWADNQTDPEYGALVQSASDGDQNHVNLLAYGRSLGIHPAFEYCDALDHNGETDWFLPTTNEMTDAYNNISGEYVADRYWTSQEGDQDDACMINMVDGTIACVSSSNSDKIDSHRTRCMRIEGVALPSAQADTDPDDLTFVTKFQTSAGVQTTSDTLTVTGITQNTAISITGDASAEYSINGGAFTSAAGTVSWDDTVAIRIDSPAAGNRAQADLTIGSDTFYFSVITEGDCGGSCAGIDKRVFVTSTDVFDSSDSISSVDTDCQSAADTAGLGGTWRAIGSGNAPSNWAVNRMDYNWDRLVNMNGDVITTTASGLWDGNIDNAILYDEDSVSVGAGVEVRTKSYPNGTYYADNRYGLADSDTGAWMDNNSSGNLRRAYCQEVTIGTITLTSTPASGTSMNVVAPGPNGTEVTFTIENTGSGTSAALGYTLTNSTNFTVTTDTCSGNTLAPAATCDIGVTPTASADGDYNGTLTVEDTTNNVSVSIGLSGQSTGFGNTAGIWQPGTGDDIYYNSGAPMVGIGLTDPAVSLDVAGLIRPGYDAACTATEEGAIRYDSSSDIAELCDGTSWLAINTGVGGKWMDAVSTGHIYYNSSVGINTSDPQVELDIAGVMRAIDDTATCTTPKRGAIRFNSAGGEMQLCDGSNWKLITTTNGLVNLVFTPVVHGNMDVDGTCGTATCDGTPVTFLLGNTGTQTSAAITYTSSGDLANFEVTSDTCWGNTLAPGASCQIDAKPQATGDGTYNAKFTVDVDNTPIALMQGTATGFNCAPGIGGPGGTYVACGAYDTVVMNIDAGTASWGGNTISRGTQVRGAGDGPQNTANLVAYSTAEGGGVHAAAEMCDNSSHGGYNDWYLPASDELIFLDDSAVEAATGLAGRYWSSRETDDNDVYSYDSSADTLSSTQGDKNSSYNIRCFRRDGEAMPAAQADTTPNAVSFTDATVSTQARVSSNIVTLTNFYTSTTATLIGTDGNPRMKINGGAEVSSGTVNYGDTVQLVMDPPASVGTYSVTLNVGSMNAAWNIQQTSSSGVCNATEIYSVSGSYGYTVPASFDTITIKMWGGGGEGGNGLAASGADGGNTTITSLSLVANGGEGGSKSTVSGHGSGGTGGTASGGDTNINGNAGTDGVLDDNGDGGNAPGGGGGGGVNGGDTNTGPAGASPGGGGAGGEFGSGANPAGGGAGSGAYVEKQYTPATLIPSTTIADLIVGAGGSGASIYGGDGGAGRISITCFESASPPTGALFTTGLDDTPDDYTSAAYKALHVNAAGDGIEFASTSAMIIPRGTTAQRPTGTDGMIRYNSTDSKFEGFQGGSWQDLITTSGGKWTTGTGDDIYYNSGAHMVGIGLTDPDVELDVAGDIEYTGTITDVSDRRLKADITPLDREDIAARLLEIDTYTFRMKDDENGQIEYGVMAQELEELFPELVKTAHDEMGTKSVNYVGLIAPMIETAKDLKAENEALRAALADSRAEQNKILAALENVQRDVDGLKAHTGYGISKAEMSLLMLLGLLLGGLGTLIITRRKV